MRTTAPMSRGLAAPRPPPQLPARRRRRAAPPPSAAANTFGTLFRVTTFGESHGKGVGCVIDGVPPRLPLSKEEVQAELDRRRPGQSRITTPRKESDTCEIYSGRERRRGRGVEAWSLCERRPPARPPRAPSPQA